MQAFFANTSIEGDLAVVVLGTGGTIAGTAASAHDVLGYTAAQLSIGDLLGSIPRVDETGCCIESEQVAQVDSKDMEVAVWQTLAERVEHHLLRRNVVGIVITHGTDTVEETAFFLHCVLPPSLLVNKPVVMTCAMRPATAVNADGPQNLLDALRLATRYTRPDALACGTPEASGVSTLGGIVVVCGGVIHSPLYIQKVHPTRLDPFDSGDAPSLGRISPDGLLMATPWSSLEGAQGDMADKGWERPVVLPKHGEAWPRVEIVLSHAAAGSALVEALLSQRLVGHAPVRGLVVAGTGNGSIHQTLLSALLDAQAKGVRVVRCSRCAFGSVQAIGSHPLSEISLLSPFKARIRLMLELAQLPAGQASD